MNSYRDYRTIHEGFLKDVIDMISTDGIDAIWDRSKAFLDQKDESKFNSAISKNIATAAKGLTAVFPVIVTEATPIDQAIMISKAVERKAVAMLEMLFAANQITSATNAYDYLNKFHNNIDDSLDWSGASIDDVLQSMNSVENSMNENTSINNRIQSNIREGIKAIQEDLKQNCNYYLSENINEDSVNDYIVRNVFNNIQVLKESRKGSKIILGKTEKKIFDIITKKGLIKNEIKPNIIINNKNPSDNKKKESSMSDLKASYDMLSKNILKTSIEKANEAVPSLIIVNFYSVRDKTKIISTAIIGVKAMLHYVSSEDMVNKIMLKNSDKNGLFNFIRATTREISFFKDFLFAVDRAKIDALSKAGKGSTSSIWKLLELRANEAKRKSSIFKHDASCSAIVTIVVSKSEVELVKKYYRMDISNPGTLKSIMRGYSIMCAVIIDEITERVDFLWDDGSQGFDTYSFSSLEREESSGMYKKVINMMNKNAR